MNRHAKPEAAADGPGATSASDAATAASTPNPSPGRRSMQVPPQVDESTPIDPRFAAQAAALRERAETQRRQPKPEEFVWVRRDECFFDLMTLTGGHSADAVNSNIPIEFHRVIVEDPPAQVEGEPARRGPRPQRRERIILPSQDIKRIESDQTVEATVWWPGMPRIIDDWMVSDDGMLFSCRGTRLLNLYREPPPITGDPAAAGLWLDHVALVVPEQCEREFLLDFLAHLVQRPEEKCNTGVVLSGAQGIGKDALLLPIKHAVGEWNTQGIDPDDVLSSFNPWVQTTLLVIDEVRPAQSEFHSTSFYNVLKKLLVTPPELLRLNEKFCKARYVKNRMRVVITTNEPLSMFIPADDRRLLILHSNLQKGWHIAAGTPDYFVKLFHWIEDGGWKHVAAYLAARDLSHFNPKAESPRTRAKDAIAGSWDQSTEDGVAYALGVLGEPEVLFVGELADPQFDHYEEVKCLIKSARKLAYRMDRAGYEFVPHPDSRPDRPKPRWTYAASDRVFRSYTAFARKGLTRDQALEALDARGRMLVARMPQGMQPRNRSEPVDEH